MSNQEPWYIAAKRAEQTEQWLKLIAARDAGKPGAAAALRSFEEQA